MIFVELTMASSREKIDRRPPWTMGRYQDHRKDTQLMKVVKSSVEVRDSPVHGKGVYATAIIPKGHIAWYRGPIFSCCYLDRSFQSHTYMMRLRDGKIVNPASKKCKHWTKFINDARGTEHENNLVIGKDGAIVAIREIQSGEELFLDYGSDYWSHSYCQHSADTL